MKQVTFGSLKAGDTFQYQGSEWTKTNKIKISCCKFINAESLSMPNNKVGLRDDQMVEVKE